MGFLLQDGGLGSPLIAGQGGASILAPKTSPYLFIERILAYFYGPRPSTYRAMRTRYRSLHRVAYSKVGSQKVGHGGFKARHSRCLGGLCWRQSGFPRAVHSWEGTITLRGPSRTFTGRY